jgi:beta-galactosidase GanA
VKTDQQRFPRSFNKEGKGMEILSAFSKENRNTDARAFTELMKHIREVDHKEHTVVMVQVENEIGMIPNARDFSSAANEEFSKPVPEDLIDYLEKNKENLIPEFYKVWEKAGFKTGGTWREIFGVGLGTDEIFMAWHYAKYVHYISEKGKAEYPLPLFVNAALIRPGYEPGRYPSGGPLPHVMDIWRAGAPSIDFLSPDIYFSNFDEWCQKYNRSGNPLFIPEVGLDANTPAHALYAFGEHDAMGFSPFSIEYLNDPENAKLTKIYDVIHQLTPIILESQGKDLMRGVLLDEEHKTATVELGDYKFHVAHDFTFGWSKKGDGPWPRVGGMIISVARDEFYIAGSGIVVTFEPNSHGDPIVGIGRIEEGKFVDGKWITGRRMNGDQSHQGRHLRIPNDEVGIQKVKLYRYR